MMKALKDWLYDFVTSSSIIYYLMPILKPLIIVCYLLPGRDSEKIVDQAGNTINATRYNGKLFPALRLRVIAGIKNLQIRHDDVFLCGYPKTGCHWMHEILYMLVKRKAVMSTHGKIFEGMIEAIPSFLIDSVPSPRVLNSHVLYEDLPVQIKEKKTKIIWTVRNPKDAVVSYYNHIVQAFAHGYKYKGTFDDYFNFYMAGKGEYGSFFDYILAWEKVMNTQKDNPILVVEYEKLKENPEKEVKIVAQFLGIDASEEFIHEVIEATNFNKMKSARGGHKVFRKGQTGDWRNWLTDDQSAEVDQVWRERMSNCFYKPVM